MKSEEETFLHLKSENWIAKNKQQQTAKWSFCDLNCFRFSNKKWIFAEKSSKWISIQIFLVQANTEETQTESKLHFYQSHFIDFFTTKTTQKVSQNKFILVVEIHFLFWLQTNFCTNGATLTFDGARGLTSTCHFSLEHVNDDVLLPRREPHVAGDVLSLAASSTHDVDGDQAGDPEVRVRPPVHLRHLRSDRARAGSAAGSTDPWTRRLHWR